MAAKRLPAEFLRSVAIDESKLAGTTVLRIPYLDRQGEEVAVRFRLSLENEPRFRWRKGDKPLPYGLWRLKQAEELGYLILVEGESDTQTLWHAGRPALGLPGAALWNEDRDAEQLDGIDTVYVVIEPDTGGAAMLAWLEHSRIRERVRLVTLDAKDASELWVATPETFGERLEQALQTATPWSEHERVRLELQGREAWKECEPLAREPRILDVFRLDLRRHGVVGEETAAQLLFLALISRLFERPISMALKGPSAGGKNWLAGHVLDFVPAETYLELTGMSERALVFSEEPLSHRHIVLYEAAGLESDFASYLIRSLLSEGRLKYAVTEKTAQGLEGRIIEREGPTGLIVTTTAVALHPENETRLLSVTITDSSEQTRQVFRAIADEDPVALELGRWQSLQRWLEAGERVVTVPFAQTLAEAVPPVAVRLRRDFGALLTLIRAHALLHRASRARDATSGRIVAEPEDYAVVRELVADLIGESVEATVPPAVRETVEAVAELADEHGVSVSKLAAALEIDKAAASRRWRRARERGYLRNLEPARGKPARIVTAEPLPEEQELLPSVDLLTVNAAKTPLSPRLGDEMYPVHVADAVKNGHVTRAEAEEAYAVHQAVTTASEAAG